MKANLNLSKKLPSRRGHTGRAGVKKIMNYFDSTSLSVIL